MEKEKAKKNEQDRVVQQVTKMKNAAAIMTLEQKDAEKSVAFAGLQTLLAAAKDEIKVLNGKVVALEISLQFTQAEHDEVKEHVATCENGANKTRKRAHPPKHL